ncbi:MAG: hypothetical protein AAGM45_21255 [Cyanobacteria bacterium J06588_5]
MPIDDYASATQLSRQLDESVPFHVRPRPPLLKRMRDEGTPMSAEHDYTVDKVMYGGDEGGIFCVIQPGDKAKTVVGASITHLTIDPSHPLAEAVKSYQRKRTHQLRLQDQRGFAALASQASTAKKRKRGSGFGR